MKTKGVSAFILLRDKRFDAFDSDMAQVTADVFMFAQLADRIVCVHDFSSIWKVCVQSNDADISSMANGFKQLRTRIEEAKEKIDNKKKITLGHYFKFMAELDKLINFCNEKLSKEDSGKESGLDNEEQEEQ